MAVEYAKNQGRRDFMDLIIVDFQVRYPGFLPPTRLNYLSARVFEPFQILKGYL